jgi:hypothetical protein
MDDRDGRFEEFLRDFHPRAPKPLPPVFGPRRPWMWLAAAAVLILICGAIADRLLEERLLRNGPPGLTARPAPPAENPAREASLGRLSQVAMEDPSGLDAALGKASRDLLPRFDRRNSTLSVLAKE